MNNKIKITKKKYKVTDSSIYTYLFESSPDKPLAIMIHGMKADTMRVFPLIKLLLNQFRILSIDLPGHGKSKYYGNHENFLEYCADVVLELIEQLDIDSRKLSLIGGSYGANVILDILIRKKKSDFYKIGLFGPLYSNKYIAFKKLYQKLLMYWTGAMSQNGFFAKFMQKIFNDGRLVSFASRYFYVNSKDPEIIDHEVKLWKVVPLWLWARTIQTFFKVDLSKEKQIIDRDNVFFIYPRHDQYISVEDSVKGFKKLFPKAKIFYIDYDGHTPSGDWGKDEKFMKYMKGVIDKFE